MADYPPFMNAYGNISKILDKIKEAKTPDRFTQDYLGTGLGFSGGSSMAFIPLAKRIGLLSADGTPTAVYRAFRNPSSSGAAMAQAIRTGYPTLLSRNEYAHKLDSARLEGLVMEATGLEKGAGALRSIVKTFEALRGFANFDATDAQSDQRVIDDLDEKGVQGFTSAVSRAERDSPELRLSYAIYLNLPSSTDINVFNAIFKSLRENLLT